MGSGGAKLWFDCARGELWLELGEKGAYGPESGAEC